MIEIHDNVDLAFWMFVLGYLSAILTMIICYSLSERK